MREMCSSPPMKKLIIIYFNSKSQETAIKESSTQANSLRVLAAKHFSQVEILGPRPSMVEKKINKFTWSLMIRSSDVNQLHNFITTFSRNYRPPHTISLKVDVDPYYFD
jgi:primosomal protein N' (replication factor Y)